MSYQESFPSNQKKSRTLNLIYRMVNALEGSNADIERSGLRNMYDLHKYDVKICIEKGSIEKLRDRLCTELIKKGYELTKNPSTTMLEYRSRDGINLFIHINRYIGEKRAIGCLIT